MTAPIAIPDTFNDGLYDRVGVPRELYDVLKTRENYSLLKRIGVSPAHYLDAATHRGSLDTDALTVGKVTHIRVFEPDRFADEVAVFEGRRAGKEWEAFQARNVGREIIREKDDATTKAIADAVRANPDAAELLAEGQAEVTALWHTTVDAIEKPFACKGRLDWISKTGAIVDLKTARDASPRAFESAAYRLGYHAQAAFYSDAVAEITGARMPFVIIAVESSAPFVVQIYEVSTEALNAGRRQYRNWLARLAECRTTGKWPGYADARLQLRLPAWADKAGEGPDDVEPDEETTEET